MANTRTKWWVYDIILSRQYSFNSNAWSLRYELIRFYIRLFACSLPKEHSIYVANDSSVNNITLSNLIWTLNQYKVCQGVSINLNSPDLNVHCIPKVFSPLSHLDNQNTIEPSLVYC